MIFGGREKNFLSFLDGLAFLRGTDILVLSAYTSPLVEEKLQMLRAAGNTVTLHLLEKGERPMNVYNKCLSYPLDVV